MAQRGRLRSWLLAPWGGSAVAASVVAVLVASGPLPPQALAAPPTQPDAAMVADLTKDWPAASRAAAQEMLGKYGPPQEATPTTLTWVGNGPWLRSIVRKTPVEHDFPQKHADVLEQAVDYRVPLNFFEALASFNGSVVPDRTRGELAAHCDSETTNILALNLARDILRGEKTADQAREAMAAAVREIAAGRVPDDARSLRVGPQHGDMRDPDTAVVAAPAGAPSSTPAGGTKASP